MKILTFFEYLRIFKHDVNLYGEDIIAWCQEMYNDKYISGIQL